MTTRQAAALEGRSQTVPKPAVNRDRLASEIMVGLAAKFAQTQPIPVEGTQLARAAFVYADAFIKEMEARS